MRIVTKSVKKRNDHEYKGFVGENIQKELEQVKQQLNEVQTRSGDSGESDK